MKFLAEEVACQHAAFVVGMLGVDRGGDRVSDITSPVQGKRHNAALICLARRRCAILFVMLRDKWHWSWRV